MHALVLNDSKMIIHASHFSSMEIVSIPPVCHKHGELCSWEKILTFGETYIVWTRTLSIFSGKLVHVGEKMYTLSQFTRFLKGDKFGCREKMTDSRYLGMIASLCQLLLSLVHMVHWQRPYSVVSCASTKSVLRMGAAQLRVRAGYNRWGRGK